MVVDVLGIGCRSKIDHLAAQASTWARNARYYWGFTEDEDFDPSCAISSEERMEEYITTCNSNKPGAAYFGSYHRPSEVGWFCAQRRPGRALGWLQIVYTRDDPPDMLILVDDDTSVDIEKAKKMILHATNKHNDSPIVIAGKVLRLGPKKYDGFLAAYGGFGTFFNKAAIQLLKEPIYCDKQQSTTSKFSKNACEKLQRNRAGESDSFTQGDSIFDIFYKYAAHPQFCMHSDWAIGFMIHHYLGIILQQALPEGSSHCDEDSVSCHRHKPKQMETFKMAHPQGPQ